MLLLLDEKIVILNIKMGRTSINELWSADQIKRSEWVSNKADSFWLHWAKMTEWKIYLVFGVLILAIVKTNVSKN